MKIDFEEVLNIDKLEGKLKKAEKHFKKNDEEEGYPLLTLVKNSKEKYQELYEMFGHGANDTDDIDEAIEFMDTLTEEIVTFLSDNLIETELEIRIEEDENDGKILINAYAC